MLAEVSIEALDVFNYKVVVPLVKTWYKRQSWPEHMRDDMRSSSFLFLLSLLLDLRAFVNSP